MYCLFQVTPASQRKCTKVLTKPRVLYFIIFIHSLVDQIRNFGSMSFCTFQFLRFSYNFLNPSLLNNNIYGRFYLGELSRSCCSRASPNHGMLYICYEIIFLQCYIWFEQNMPSDLQFGLICAKNCRNPVFCFCLLCESSVGNCIFFRDQRFLPSTSPKEVFVSFWL